MYRRLRATGRVADGDPFVAPIHDATLNDDASDATAPVDAATLECELCHSVLPSRVQLHHSMLPPWMQPRLSSVAPRSVAAHAGALPTWMQAAPLNAATLAPYHAVVGSGAPPLQEGFPIQRLLPCGGASAPAASAVVSRPGRKY